MSCEPRDLVCAFEAALERFLPRLESSGRLGTLRSGIAASGKVKARTFDSGSAYDARAFGPGEAVAVVAGGSAAFNLRFRQSDGTRFELPAVPGVYPIPHSELWLDTDGETLTAPVVLLQGPRELLHLPAPATDWESYVDRQQAAGDTTIGWRPAAGWEYDIQGAYQYFDADGSAGTRRNAILVKNPDADETLAGWYFDEPTPDQVVVGTVAFGPGGSAAHQGAAANQATLGIDAYGQAWFPVLRFRLTSALSHDIIQSIVTSGAAGDSHTLTVMGRRRRIAV